MSYDNGQVPIAFMHSVPTGCRISKITGIF